MRQMGGYEDLTPGRTASGVEAVRQRAYHIADTPPGSLPQDPEWGWAVRDLVGIGLEPGDLKTAEAIGREAFRRDPEILDASAPIEELAPGRARIPIALETTYGQATTEAVIR